MIDTSTRVLVMPAANRETFLARLVARLKVLPPNQWDLEIRPHKTQRTMSQNALLWALYDDVLKQGGETLRGWTKEELHEFACGEYHGWEVTEAFGRKHLRPRKGSSKLSKAEFSDFVEAFVIKMAQHGIVLKLPGESEAA